MNRLREERERPVDQIVGFVDVCGAGLLVPGAHDGVGGAGGMRNRQSVLAVLVAVGLSVAFGAGVSW